MSVRKLGVEEELMLVDPATGQVAAVAERAVRARTHDDPEVEQELFLQQIETATPPCLDAADLDKGIRAGRRAVGQAAAEAGAEAVAVPTPILVDVREHFTRKPRYQRIGDEFGETARQSMVCAMHMHVDITDDAEGVAVIDRIRPWLPVLLGLSANSR
jgi:carboxylate-amine ligase